MVNSKKKGDRGELEAAKAVSEHLGVAARRGRQYNGVEGKDILTELDGIHFEVKRREKFSLYPAMEQAQRDADRGEIPVVLHRRNKKPWVVCVLLSDVVRFAETINVSPDR